MWPRNSVYICCSVLLLLSLGCGNNPSEPLDDQQELINTTLPEHVHNTIKIKRHFSNPVHADQFILTIDGDDYRTAKLDFVIIDHKYDTLFYRSALAYDLINCEHPTNWTVDKENETIQLYFSSFFAETGFSNPPFTINDPTKEDFSGDLELWNAIREDSLAWCFEFSLKKNGGLEVIAYSKALDSILVYDSTP